MSTSTSSDLKKQAEGNILTFLRIKPSKNPSGFFNEDDLNPGSLVFNLPENLKQEYINNSKLNYAFHFNGILGMNSSQEDVFSKVGTAAVQNAMEGYNSTIFAYGQTGSGKTFTITGGAERYSDRGIIPRAISMIYNKIRSQPGLEFKAYISYLEIYNEHGYDLLDPSQETKALEDLPKVSILEDEHGNFHLKGLSMHVAETEEAALNLLFLGDTNRAIAETPMNLASSRSHCIFTLSMECRQAGSELVRRSKLHLVDLAGSERVSKTNSSGKVLNEAKYINTSLFFLEMVIVALYEKATKGRLHIPYRNSFMTSVLRDSLGGNCKTIMVATINPEAVHTEESLSTCKFAQRVSLIKNRAVLNEGTDPQVIIRRLKDEVLALREEVAFLKGDAGEGDALTPSELENLKQKCREYCDDSDPCALFNPGVLTLTVIKDCFAIFKNMVIEARVNSKGEGICDNRAVDDDGCLQKQIKDLKSCLLQRDNEIAILVNMVKKGKIADDIIGSQADEDNSQTDFKRSSNVKVDSKEEKLIRRHLHGVPPPDDRTILDDLAVAFEYFRTRCEFSRSIEENKLVLREKMMDAQMHGERANKSRETINYLKSSIESIRRERALQGLSNFEGKSNDDESPEEATYRRAIEQEKAVYKESFEKLRVLKPEIEHIRKLLEKGRATLQSQFDVWINAVSTRPDFGHSQTKSSEQFHPDRQSRRKQQSAAPKIAEEIADDTNEDIMAFYKAKEDLLKRRNAT